MSEILLHQSEINLRRRPLSYVMYSTSIWGFIIRSVCFSKIRISICYW